MSVDVVITRGLTKHYGTHVALTDVDLSIGPGEIFGYLGPNGAGKTTTIRLLMGMLRATAGTAQVFGLDCWGDSAALHERVGYVPGDPALYDRLTARELLHYLGRLRGRYDESAVQSLTRRLDLELDRPIRALSRGNKQKVVLVQAMMHRPQLLILDEPTSGLDPLVQLELQHILQEHAQAGGTVLLSSHVLSEVQRIADRVAIIRAGRLVAVERLAELRARSVHHVVAQFAEPVDVAMFSRIDGVRDVQVADHGLTCSAAQTALDELVKELAQHRLVDLACEEASLDETFLAYYGEEVGGAA